MKILFLSPVFPYPPIGGGTIRIFTFLDYLSRTNQVDLLTFYHSAEELKNLSILGSRCRKIVPVCDIESRYAEISGKIKNMILLNPYGKNKKFQNEADRLLACEKYDLIHIEKFFLYPYVEKIKDIPVVIDTWATGLGGAYKEFKYERNILIKMRKLIQFMKFIKYDRKVYKEISKIIVVSEEGKSLLEKKNKNLKICVIPQGVDHNYFSPLSGFREPCSLVFTGDMSFFPNVDAVHYFYDKIYPGIKERYPDVKFYLVGMKPVRSMLNIAKKDKSVIVTGFVNDIRLFLNKASIYVCPIRAGAGTRNKLLEAFAMEKAVVATSNSLEGLRVKDKEHLLIADTEKDFIDKTLLLLNDRGLNKELGKNARKLVVNEFETEKFLSCYEELLR
jgi:polysaccharide biosynthesis protein PslH